MNAKASLQSSVAWAPVYRAIQTLDWERRLCRRRLCAARALIEQDIASNQPDLRSTDLRTLAESVHLSRYHFQREFKRAFGESPHQLATRLRLERAQQLLLQTDASVTEICFSVGFESLGSFSSLFSRKLGRSPANYRRRMVQVQAELRKDSALLIPGCFQLRFLATATSEKRSGSPRG